MKVLLAVDVGGTKAELALFNLQDRSPAPARRAVFPCARYGGIEEIISAFLREAAIRPDCACLGVAGVVRDGRAKITNLPWLMTEEVLAEAFSLAGVKLINDMTALCAAIPSLGEADLLTLSEGTEQRGGVKAVIAPGTGLGEGYLLDTGTTFLPLGSEGGHADFAPADEEQIALLHWLRRTTRPVSFEMLCSGLAIPTLYAFCREHGGLPERPEIAAQLAAAADRTPVIVNGAIAASPCPLCLKTLALFLAILGSEAGNLALKTYAVGGVYIGGGLLPRLAGAIPFAGLTAAFRNKAKMADLLAGIPLRLIVKRDAVLAGACEYGRRHFAARP